MTESPEQRSRIMRAVHSRNTSPELAIRQLLRSLGFTGYRLHRNDLPGKPDIAFIGRRKAIFVQGCFWHGHDCPRGSRQPATNIEYWNKKISRNRQRDKEHLSKLAELGWATLEIWECQLREHTALTDKLIKFISE